MTVSQTRYLRAGNLAESTVLTQQSSVATTLVLASGGGASFPAFPGDPYIIWVDTEAQLVTGRSTDTLTVVRGWEGTSAALHVVTSVVQLNVSDGYNDVLADKVKALEAALDDMQGNSDGIIRGLNSGNLAVGEQSSPTLSVDVLEGRAMVSNTVFDNQTTAVVGPFAEPTGGNDRVDLIQVTTTSASDSSEPVGLNIKQGVQSGSPSAPSLDSNSIAIAHVYNRDGQSSIKDADDSTNGYIMSVAGVPPVL